MGSKRGALFAEEGVIVEYSREQMGLSNGEMSEVIDFLSGEVPL